MLLDEPMVREIIEIAFQINSAERSQRISRVAGQALATAKRKPRLWRGDSASVPRPSGSGLNDTSPKVWLNTPTGHEAEDGLGEFGRSR